MQEVAADLVGQLEGLDRSVDAAGLLGSSFISKAEDHANEVRPRTEGGNYDAEGEGGT